ncbi:enoyl-CoA hydratase/isomerase family protein [Alkalicoccus daliensis]|uniref:2-(1,2-epoxy-1,2-dihydrophenyl)acetyl-CoA isomerase n=1 Tax=Alkalicoccus daliensis TaxID=745820 RepID=A0A1H0J0C4_9BACI|nr:enoyl-CoA hydratase-related protein [Alkalicoccus daliensis]SDO37013.1 2-(1,2-epoxy-1,2-dihydrophenyl)acetyl-CoA isomerase [Alkalicoccus daliensis]
MKEALVQHSLNKGIATIALNRPDSLNALNNDMIADLIHLFQQFNLDEHVRVIVLEGKGRSFCAGDDLIDMGTEKHPNPKEKLTEFRRGYPEVVLAMRKTEKPIIAKIHGHALGAGLEIALGADIIIAAEKTKLGLPFVLRGIAAGTSLLPQIIGYHKTSELLFTGKMLTAKEAESLGIVNEVTSDEKLKESVDKLTGNLSSAATRAIGLMKLGLNRSLNKTMEEAFDEQSYLTTLSFHTEDFSEGKEAFTQKRESVFKGL